MSGAGGASTAGRPVAFVTGGSSGIGRELARKLALRGFDLGLIARGEDRLAQTEAALAAEVPGARVEWVAADVGDETAARAASQALVGRLGIPSWVIFNAGIARPGLFLEQPLSDHLAQMRTNYFGALSLAHELAPRMAAVGGGRMVFVSSGAALFGIYGYGAYAPSKFAMRGLAEVLRVELAECGVSVTLAYPPDTDTPQLAVEELTKPAATKEITSGGGLWQADKVAEEILRGAERGRFLVAPGVQMRLLAHAHSLLAPALRAWQVRVARRCEKLFRKG
jgi:3-dehydrosphinganine reductase